MDAFLALTMLTLALITAAYGVTAALRARTEETSGRAEPVLANAVGRLRWAAGHLVIAFGGAVLIMLLSGLGLTLGYGADPGPILAACMVQLPAIWTLGALAVLLHGLAPRLAPASWAATPRRAAAPALPTTLIKRRPCSPRPVMAMRHSR